MAQIPENIEILINKYLKGTITDAEKLILNEWYHSFNDSETEVNSSWEDTEQLLSGRIKARLLETIQNENPQITSRRRRKWQVPAAAILLILVSFSAYFFYTTKSGKPQIAQASPGNVKPKTDLTPGGNKAILTLADGSHILLDSASNGTLSKQGNIKIRKLNNGLIDYIINSELVTPGNEVLYNTIATPRGGEYQVTLSDGTKVWLNAASSIRFPVSFTGKERKVVITGEAYFEVAKNKAMPFKVEANNSEIEVLGTHFNVNAYDDEAYIKTTLLEGKVKISSPALAATKEPKFLLPGQQADVNKQGKISILDNADTEEAVAWMHGYFQFKSADLKAILRQISRWYDADIVYNGNVNLHFTGQLNKKMNVSKVFETLALTNEVHFKIDGKKIIVSP